MKSIKVLLAVLAMAAFTMTSCSDDDEGSSGPAEGKMTSTIDGKSVEFTVMAMVYSGTSGSESYEYLIVYGTKGTTQADMATFGVTVYAKKLEAKKYSVPTYSDTYDYSYIDGFAMGVYMPDLGNTDDYYYSFMVEKSSGSVTISSITDTNVQGSYDMVLVNYVTTSKTMTLKGDFNAKITDIEDYKK